MDRKLTAEELKDRIGTLQGVYPDQLDPEVMWEAGLKDIVLPLPRSPKARSQALGNILVQLCLIIQVEDPLLKEELLSLSTSLSYLLNSTSYDTGTYHSFDKKEVSKKLHRRP